MAVTATEALIRSEEFEKELRREQNPLCGKF